MKIDHSNYQLLPDEGDFEDDEVMDAEEYTQKVVGALKEATRQAWQEKRRSERLVYDEQDDSLLFRYATLLRKAPAPLVQIDCSVRLVAHEP